MPTNEPSERSDLLFEIGVEELPASFVEAALRALPELATKQLADRRLAHGAVRALGTPRRLALLVEGVAARQSDLEEELVGPPVKAAFKDGAPTKAAEAFAQKLGCAVGELRRVETPKGEYLTGTRRAKGEPTATLLPDMLTAIALGVPFRKSMRWGAGDVAFGRPIQWLVALLGADVVPVRLAGVASGRASRGHRFLAPANLPIAAPSAYVDTLRAAHVLVDPAERTEAMRTRLEEAAAQAGGVLVQDAFLMGENLSLVEEPHILVGGYDDAFLELPERVILEVAKGHQRYFGLRTKSDARLMPKYLAVVNTAKEPENIRRGNDRVMRARLSDARFFYREDVRVPLADRRAKLGGIVFQKRLGSMLAKAERIERLARELGLLLMLPEPTLMAAASGAHLAKCDLVSLMVGEFPELEGEMGRAYAIAQGAAKEAADVIREHYSPRGAHDATAPSDAGALVALADRLDSLVGCFAIGLAPTGATDPYGLRRAALGVLRTCLDRGFDLALGDACRAAYDGYAGQGVSLDLDKAAATQKVGEFFADRAKGLLSDKLPADAVLAALAVAPDRPLDARARAQALAGLDATIRAQVGEVFKRATNIASEAPPGEPSALPADAHASEHALLAGYESLRARIADLAKARDYPGAFAHVATFAPLLQQYFVDVFVMTDDLAVRDNRLRLMRGIASTCSTLARLELLAQG